MSRPQLRPSPDISAADWLKPRLGPFGEGVASIVPDGFPAYVRILHPARGVDGVPMRWAEVAAWSGATMHALAQFHAIASVSGGQRFGPQLWDGEFPPSGNLPLHLLKALTETLATHTTTAASCWFCLWEGYGWVRGSPSSVRITSRARSWLHLFSQPVPPAFPPEVLHGPRVGLPNRDYILFEGPVEAASALAQFTGSAVLDQSPNLFWPQDHAWCVASEIDLYCTLVGGSDLLVEALLASERLEAWRVGPGDPVRADSDLINTPR